MCPIPPSPRRRPATVTGLAPLVVGTAAAWSSGESTPSTPRGLTGKPPDGTGFGRTLVA